MNRVASSVAAAFLLLVGGCGGPHAIKGLRIVNAPGPTGAERLAVCDECGASSPCGTTASTSTWAVDHYRKTERRHKAFTRQVCQTALGENWAQGVRGPQPRELPTLDEQRRAADQALTRGMRINQAFIAMGGSGVTERETPTVRTIRFRQSVTDGVRTFSRSAWADFQAETGQLVDVRYGPWGE